MRHTNRIAALAVAGIALTAGCSTNATTLDTRDAASAPSVAMNGCDFYGPRPADQTQMRSWLDQQRAATGKVVVSGWPNGDVKGYLRWDDYKAMRDYTPAAGTPDQMKAASNDHQRQADANPLVVYDCRTDQPVGRWINNFGWVSNAEYTAPNYSPAEVVVNRAGPAALAKWQQATRFWQLTAERAQGPLSPADEAEYQSLLAQAQAQVTGN